MKTIPCNRHRRQGGYISYVVVLSFGLVLTLMLVSAYRNAIRVQEIQKTVQLRTDLLSKEDAVLRSLIAIVPNRAIRAMQSGSERTTASKTPLQWGTIFTDALDQANARNSVSTTVMNGLNLGTTFNGNSGDSTLTSVSAIFDPVEADDSYSVSGFSGTRYVASGLNHSLGTGYPPVLNTTDTGWGSSSNLNTQAADILYPIISTTKFYGSYANGNAEVGLPVATYPQFNKIKYPRINFGYAKAGDWFVAKRNWWAFSMNIYQNDFGTNLEVERDYVLSIYEIPSQLSISSNAFTAIGKYASGANWENVSVEGGIFAGKAQIEGSTVLDTVAGRRGVSVASGSQVGGTSFGSNNPFTPGRREQYEIDNNTTGEFYPVSLPSESGRAVFVPINRGAEFFDRFGLTAEANTISKTTWNNYSVGALQCAMKLDITDVQGTTGVSGSGGNQTPTAVRFTYKKAGVDTVQNLTVNVTAWATSNPPKPFSVKMLGSRPCVVVRPELFPAYLTSLGADGPAVNHSLVVNPDYTVSTRVRKPIFPCIDSDIGVILENCANLTSFTKGFSLVTNMRLYIGDDFNITETTVPTGSGLPAPYYPPASLYAPERRFGTDVDPWKVEFGGRVGSLASDDKTTPTRPLDMTTSSGAVLAADKITVNLKPITHPAALPPVTMMNWLVIVEERRKEFY